MKKSLIAIVTASVALTAAPAIAGNTQIKYKDLDLATAEGQEILEKRIDRAAREICGLDEIRTGTRIRDHSARSCYETAKKQANKQMAAVIDRERLGG